MMHCKYCGASLKTSGGHCPSCGKMIPIDQQREIKRMMDPKWNLYRNKDTAFYKRNQNQDEKIGKIIFLFLAILIIIIIMVVIKGMS